MKLIIVTLILLVALPSYSQNTGYLGKLNTITLRAQPSIDLTENKTYRTNTTVTLTNFFDFSYYRIVKRNLKIGGGIGYGKVKLRTSRQFIRRTLFYNEQSQKIENYYVQNNLTYSENSSPQHSYGITYSKIKPLEINRFYIELAVEFSKRKLFVLGNITQKLGLRYGRASFVEKDYDIPTGNNAIGYQSAPANIKELVVDSDSKVFNDIQLTYGVALNKPITNSLILRYGMSLALGPFISKSNLLYWYRPDVTLPNNSASIYDARRLEYFYKRTLFSNPVSIDLGLIFAF